MPGIWSFGPLEASYDSNDTQIHYNCDKQDRMFYFAHMFPDG